MAGGDEPTLGEVLRRLDTVQTTLSQVVTVSHLELVMKAPLREIEALTRALDAERRERKAEDEKLRIAIEAEEQSRQGANRWAIGIGLTVLTVLLGYLGFVVNVLGGAPT